MLFARPAFFRLAHLYLLHPPSWSLVPLNAETVRHSPHTAALPSTIYTRSLLTRESSEYKSKGGLKQDELRRRREEQQVEIRRQKREENISKRRNFLPTTDADSDDEESAATWGESPVRRIASLHAFPVSLTGS